MQIMAQPTPRKKGDEPLTGWITGLLLPPLTFFLIWYIWAQHRTFLEFITTAIRANVLTKFLSLAALPNLLLFFIYIWTKRDFAAKGVLYATFITALVIVALKFIL
jgi:hypothetical protein